MERPHKKRKLEAGGSKPSGIEDTDQLYAWTQFRESTGDAVRDGLVSFEHWLAEIPKLENLVDQSLQFQSLKQYCDLESNDSHSGSPFYNVVSTWFFAVENNADSIVSASATVLAQFLSTISGIIELRESGLDLIDHLLNREQTKLFEKCFNSHRSRSQLASTCIRLLTEMVSFDAGARATAVWLRKDLWMYKLDSMLEPRNIDKEADDTSAPSLRGSTLLFVVTTLKYFDASAKTSILFQARALHTCLSGLTHDGSEIVVRVLQTVDQHLVQDALVSREAIRAFFNTVHLDTLVKLYGFDVEDSPEARENVRSAVHTLLTHLCTRRDGIAQSGERAGQPQHFEGQDEDFIDLGFDSPYYHMVYKTTPNKQQEDLTAFTLKLRVFNDTLQKALCLGILSSWPSILPHFISNHSTIAAADSDSSDWRTEFAFWLSVIGLPALESLSSPTPTTLSEQLESILPSPVDKGHIKSLLTSKDNVLIISAARLVTTALEKFRTSRQYLSQQDSIWMQYRQKLAYAFEERLPLFSDISHALQQTSIDEDNTVSMLLECLVRFAEVLPHAVTTTTFNISPVTNLLCERIEHGTISDTLGVENLVQCARIATLTNSTKWYHKPGDTILSPCTRLLRLSISMTNDNLRGQLQSTMGRVLMEGGVITNDEAACKALCLSLKAIDLSADDEAALYLFIDNCIVRTQKQPVKYLDHIESTCRHVSDPKPLCLLVAAIVEQFNPYFAKVLPRKNVLKGVSKWLACWFQMLDAAAENYRAISYFQEVLLQDSSDKAKQYLSKAFAKAAKKGTFVLEMQQDKNGADMDKTTSDLILSDITAEPVLYQNNDDASPTLDGLDKWSARDIDIEFEIASGRLGRLIRCIGVLDDEIRLQAFQTLQNVGHIVDTASTHPEKRAVWLVLGEICQTVREYGLTNPLPTIVGELGCEIVQIVIDPTHAMYTKINKFVLARPSWSPKRIFQHWLDRCLYKEPTNDTSDAVSVEVVWLLTLLSKGLRNQLDLDLYRRNGVWEKIGSLYASPTTSAAEKTLILDIISRGISIPGGADMLWTRFGMASWLRLQLTVDDQNSETLQRLHNQLGASCNTSSIESWMRTCLLTKTQG